MNNLTTPFEQNIGFCEYPRPQLVRESFLSLNGNWQFYKNGRIRGKITVPFPPESRISGIFRNLEPTDVTEYRRTFTLPDSFKKDRVLLHFGAVDRFCVVSINDRVMGEHDGGYLPFTLDVTDALCEGENVITVNVSDNLDPDYPYGKQRVKRGGMWYTPTSGIWQTVWLESVCDNYIKSLRLTPALDSVLITVLGGCDKKTLIFEGKEYEFCGETYLLRVEDPVNWTPDTPHLYDFEIVCGADRIRSYFALRTVSVVGRDILLNGKPYFFHGLLDQGYFSDGIFTPASEEGYRNDILTAKKCGFNMLRKHIKLEPDLFYYYCDKYGMAVFQDFVNSGKYSFMIDTALPTVLLRRGISHGVTANRREQFIKTGEGIQEVLYNHPSVLYYTIFNEGWGQFDADGCYTHFKTNDPTRVYDTTSGWFKTKKSDVESDHVYFKKVKLKKTDRPMVLSEFGGFSCRVRGHHFNPDSNMGYSFFTEDPAEFEKKLISLYERDVIPNIANGLCVTVLTQLSDVEDETNGIMTYDRQVLKVDPAHMRELSQKIFDEFNKKC